MFNFSKIFFHALANTICPAAAAACFSFNLSDLFLSFNSVYAASGSSSSSGQVNLYKSGKKLVTKAKKLEKKDKIEKAKKLYLKAYEKFEKAYKRDKKNIILKGMSDKDINKQFFDINIKTFESSLNEMSEQIN